MINVVAVQDVRSQISPASAEAASRRRWRHRRRGHRLPVSVDAMTSCCRRRRTILLPLSTVSLRHLHHRYVTFHEQMAPVGVQSLWWKFPKHYRKTYIETVEQLGLYVIWLKLIKPGIERVQALADISRSALCCHSNETRAPIANPPNSAQLDGTPYHSPKLHPGPCSCVGMRRGTDRQTHRHTDDRDHYTSRFGYASTRNVI